MRTALALLLLLLAGSSAASGFEPFSARYELRRGSLTLGEARFELTASPDRPDCQIYRYEARPQGLARLFIGTLSERSEFCRVDGRLQPLRFEYQRADRPKDGFSLAFDARAGTVTSSRGEIRSLEPGMTDRLLMQLQIRDWVRAREGLPGDEELAVTMVEDDRVKAYRFRILAREPVQTPAGRVDNAVRVERVDDPRKSTRFWLDPAQGYGAVKVEQVKEGSEQLSLWRLP
ncbi:MAG TPA: DUF3108 domain-containing protein [Nevskiaceae bacterium]|nr:DUF3108 domain-containing protein [Nevskiaceae bacterium]